MNVTPQLTNAGWELLTRAIGGETITFTGMKVGSGNPPADPAALTDIVTEVYAFGIDEIDTSVSQQVSVKGQFDSSQIPYDFYFRECGLFCAADAVKTFAGTGSQTAFVLDAVTTGVYPYAVKEVKVDGTATTAYTYNASTGTVTFTTAPASGAVIVVDALEANLLYAYLNAGQEAGLVEKVSSLPREFVINMAVVVGEAANVTALLTTAQAYASQADLDALAEILSEHASNTNNPHQVTAAQLGLGNVAAPTYTPGTASTPLASGESLATALGKIAGHIADKNNPHETSVSNIQGVMPISKGGTGVTTLAALQSLVGSGGALKFSYGTYLGNQDMASNSWRALPVTVPSTAVFVIVIGTFTGGVPYGTNVSYSYVEVAGSNGRSLSFVDNTSLQYGCCWLNNGVMNVRNFGTASTGYMGLDLPSHKYFYMFAYT